MTDAVRLTVVGNPDNRRVALFAAAAAPGRAARRRAVLPVAAALPAGAGPACEPGRAGAASTRPGEDAEVDRLLRGRGRAGRARRDRRARRLVRAASPRRWAGSAAAARRRTPAAQRPGRDPDHVRQAALPRPAGRGRRRRCRRPAGAGARLRATCARRWRRPAGAGSSSSRPTARRPPGVLALATGAAAGSGATTSVELVRRRPAVQLAAGAPLHRRARRRRHCGRAGPGRAARRAVVPKAGLRRPGVDLRVVVIAGRPSHVVVRASRSPDDQPAPRRRRGATWPRCGGPPATAYRAGAGHLRRGRRAASPAACTSAWT